MSSDLHPYTHLDLANEATLAPYDDADFSIDADLSDQAETIIEPSKAEDPPSAKPAPPTVPPTKHWLLRTRLVVIDCAGLFVSWVVLGYFLVDSYDTLHRLAPGACAAVVTLFAMRSVGLYRARLCTRRADEIKRIFIAGLWGAAAFALVQHHLKNLGPQVLACFGAYVVVLALCRWQYGRWLRAQRAKGRWLRGVVLVGSNDDAAQLATMLRSEPELGYLVTGVIGDCTSAAPWDKLPTSPSICSIPHLAAATGASGVLIVPYALSSASTQNAIAISAGANLHVQVWPGWPGIGNQRLRQTPLSDEPFFYVEPRASTRWQPIAKRALDLVGASFILLLTSPIIAASALFIKLEDHGPVFHRGERVGLGGTTFLVYKLRSMTPNDGQLPPDLATMNERIDGPLFKASNDPRVTRIGKFLRASSIDELPQLFNVLQGTMSLVGPRPALPSEAAQFDDELQRRHSVRPGVTGLWQVEARHNPSFNAYRRLDLRYVDNWSLWLDLTILASTVPSVASQAVGSLRRTQ